MDDRSEEEPLPVKPGSLHAGTTSINKRFKIRIDSQSYGGARSILAAAGGAGYKHERMQLQMFSLHFM